MRFATKLRCAVASAAILAAAPASAQSVDRIVAFGDSYTDDGNLWQLLGIPPLPVYPNGRFSNGTNLIDTMSLLLNVPVDNFAIGGAFTDNGNINGVGIPGFVTEYQSFLAGGGPAAFPRVSGTFDPNDLLVISIGGNDSRAYRLGGGTVAGAPAAAAVRVAQATAGLNALVGAGARNITFIAGDAGRLPEAVGTPSAPAGTAFSNAFNTGMQATLAGYAEQGVIVNYLDLSVLGDVVENNLEAFGLVSAGACPISCVTTNPEQLSQYLFYVDRLHLTSRGFEIVGQYAVRQLEAPLTFEAQTDAGLSSASGFGQLMSGRLDLGGGDPEHPLSFYVVGTAASHDVRASGTGLAYDYDSVGGTAGAEYDLGAGLVGVAVSYSRPEADSLSGTAATKATAVQIGAYAKFEMGGAFAEGYAGIGWLDYDFRRTGVIDEIEADTEGTSLVAGAEAGYLFPMGGVSLGPVVGVQYAKANLDDYTEAGDPVLTLNVGEQRASELVGYAGAEAEFQTEIGGLSVEPFVKLLAEKDLESNTREIRYGLTAAPTIVNRFNLEESDDDLYGRIEGGASFDLGGAFALQLQASATFEHPEHDEFSGFVGLKVGF